MTASVSLQNCQAFSLSFAIGRTFHTEHSMKCHEQLTCGSSVGSASPGLAPGARAEEVDLTREKQEGT